MSNTSRSTSNARSDHDEAAGLGQQMRIVDRLAHLLVRVFEDGERSEAHHLKAGGEDKTDTPHGRLCECPKRSSK